MEESHFVSWKTILADISGLLIGGIALSLFEFVATPTRRGYFCDDQSIQYPFQSSVRVPTYALLIGSFGLPIVVLTLTEILSARGRRGRGSKMAVKFLCLPTAPSWCIPVYRNLIDFLFGATITILITDVGKYSIGRLRPNFLDRCGPIFGPNILDCSTQNVSYIEDYVCSKMVEDDAKEYRLSFPSGHASLSAYAMVYTAIFLHVRIKVSNNNGVKWKKVWKGLFQTGLVLMAYFTSLSRVMDHMHHWSDVVAGAAIGLAVAFYTARLFRHEKGLPVIQQCERRSELELDKNSIKVTNHNA